MTASQPSHIRGRPVPTPASPSASSPTPRAPVPDAERLLALWQDANDVLYAHDLTGRFTLVNAAARTTFGYTEEEFLALSIKDLVDPAHLATAQANLQAKATGGTTRSPPYELLTRAKGGRPVWVEVSTRIVLRDGKPVEVQGVARDITARKEAEAVAELVHEAALALHEASSFEAGAQDALARVAKAAGWRYAEAWLPDADGAYLVLGPQWSEGEGLEKFMRLAKQVKHVKGEGMTGLVWAEARTRWSADLANETTFMRRAAAQAAGLRMFAAVPVVNEGQVLAVLAFFSDRSRPEDARWVAAAEKVAAQLGAAFRRRLDVERVRTAGRLFAAQFEAVDDALLMLDAEGAPRQANRAFLDLCGVRLGSTDAAVPLTERIDDKGTFLSAVATLYEDRSAGREAVHFGGRTLRRTVVPLRSRHGQSLGVLLRLREDGDALASSRP